MSWMFGPYTDLVDVCSGIERYEHFGDVECSVGDFSVSMKLPMTFLIGQKSLFSTF